MPATRSTDVHRFRESQSASRIHLLTISSPFNPNQDRFVLSELPQDSFLVACAKCSPRVSIGYGQLYIIRPDRLRQFLSAVEAASDAWDNDAIAPDVHDGITITLEMADEDGTYHCVRMVDPPEDSPQARLLAAWLDTFPQVRRALPDEVAAKNG